MNYLIGHAQCRNCRICCQHWVFKYSGSQSDHMSQFDHTTVFSDFQFFSDEQNLECYGATENRLFKDFQKSCRGHVLEISVRTLNQLLFVSSRVCIPYIPQHALSSLYSSFQTQTGDDVGADRIRRLHLINTG